MVMPRYCVRYGLDGDLTARLVQPEGLASWQHIVLSQAIVDRLNGEHGHVS
jgi:hypothetical protein